MISEDLGQLNSAERSVLAKATSCADSSLPPRALSILEVGTWLGGGSTATFLQELKMRGRGHLWGIEAFEPTFRKMCKAIEQEEGLSEFFTPVLGYSQEVIPRLLEEGKRFDIIFLDGGNNPLEQIQEFQILEKNLAVGAVVFSHDAKLRKGHWFVPYIKCLDNWEVKIHDISDEGLLEAKKIYGAPSRKSKKAAFWKLLRLRMNPVELGASLLPKRVRTGLILVCLKCMPWKWVKYFSEGRG